MVGSVPFASTDAAAADFLKASLTQLLVVTLEKASRHAPVREDLDDFNFWHPDFEFEARGWSIVEVVFVLSIARLD